MLASVDEKWQGFANFETGVLVNEVSNRPPNLKPTVA
jgi:hypothetical protein